MPNFFFKCLQIAKFSFNYCTYVYSISRSRICKGYLAFVYAPYTTFFVIYVCGPLITEYICMVHMYVHMYMMSICPGQESDQLKVKTVGTVSSSAPSIAIFTYIDATQILVFHLFRFFFRFVGNKFDGKSNKNKVFVFQKRAHTIYAINKYKCSTQYTNVWNKFGTQTFDAFFGIGIQYFSQLRKC